MPRHILCLLFCLVSQHKLICRSILPVLLFNFLLRHKMPCCDRISAFFLFLVSRQVPPGFDIQHKKPCRNIISLCLISLVTLFLCYVATSFHLSRHSSPSIFSHLCYDRRNIVVTDFLSHLLERCRYTELCHDIDCCNCSFSILYCLDFLIFKLKLSKHKIGE